MGVKGGGGGGGISLTNKNSKGVEKAATPKNNMNLLQATKIFFYDSQRAMYESYNT